MIIQMMMVKRDKNISIFIKSKKLIPALVLALTLVCGITVGASAASGLQEIAAYLDAEG